MNISIWNTADEPNRIRKSLPTVTPVSGTVRDPGSVDVLNPVILIAGQVDPAANYCYIDVFSRMQIEKLILDFCPTMLMVEHDVRFQEKTATKIIRL